MLLVLDTLAATLAGGLAFESLISAGVFGMLAIPALGSAGAYDRHAPMTEDKLRTAGSLMVTAAVCVWLTGLVAGIIGDGPTTTQQLAAWGATLAAWIGARHMVGRWLRRTPQRVVILGSGVIAARARATLERHAGTGVEILGVLDEMPRDDDVSGLEVLGGTDLLQHLVATGQVDRVVVAFLSQPDAQTLAILRACDESGVLVDIVPRMFELVGRNSRAYGIGGLTLTTVPSRERRLLQRAAKRTLDVGFASALIVLALPLFALIAIAIKLSDGGPILYRQLRVGRAGRPFRIRKFRSMSVATTAHDAEIVASVGEGTTPIGDAVAELKAGGDPRVTRLGALLRRTSLDELPQLFDVLQGTMSLVGPRPLRQFEVDSLMPWEQLRHLERPGITGLWQVTGRSDIDWNERMYLDYSYARHWSLAQDLTIMARTVPVVLSRAGAR